MTGPVGSVGVTGGFAGGEGDPAQFLDVGEGTELGGSGDVVVAVGGEEGLVVGIGEAGEVGVVDGDLHEVTLFGADRERFEVEQNRLAVVGDGDVALPGVSVQDEPALGRFE
ncbi:hypothetical protein [Amycolatopsis sp. ATCC 39116]|uniref:hypothetical protein n=1 Tax=Amycolatopsis sp. (strain ATCC 39116 / 75iv2) TaxID=385957 RepID=UPI00036CA384|nr:hypothetical protein [Amycolatopsis sp. ATCC 39116]